jgi:hypothetical protein
MEGTMEWTPELDATLTDLYEKRLGNSFIASWMRLKSADIRQRLIELGLVKPPTPHTASAPAPTRKALRAAALTHCTDTHGEDAMLGDEDDDDDDGGEMVQYRGRPRGYLMSAEKISQLYRSVGRSY